MLLKSWISCSSVHGSLRKSSSGCTAPESCGVFGCVSCSGVEVALALAFLRGGISAVMICGEDGESGLVVDRTRRTSRRQVQGFTEPVLPVGLIRISPAPPSQHHDHHPTMDGDQSHDVFSSNDLWKESKLFADPELRDSTLFEPLQLECQFIASRRVNDADCQ
jgi:hypothetical protein